MRTTVELTEEHRARLLELAARRGEKGFSSIVREALDDYFDAEADRLGSRERALGALGSFDDRDAEAVRDEIETLRAKWR